VTLEIENFKHMKEIIDKFKAIEKELSDERGGVQSVCPFPERGFCKQMGFIGFG